MKKSLLIMAAALTAWSANAQLYVTGNEVYVGDKTSKWDAAGALECATEGDYYTFEAVGEFTISTVRAGWDDGWKTGTYTLDGSWNTTETSATAALKRVDGNIPAAKAGEKVAYKVKNDFSSIEATFSNAQVEEYFALHGQIFGNPSWSSENMTLNGDNWEWTGEIVAGDFGMKKMAGGEQIDWIGGSATISEANTEYSFVYGENSSCSLTGTYTIVYNPTANTIEFKGGVTPPPPTPVDLFLVGAFNGWAPADAAYKMANEDNTYTISLEALPAGEFKIMGETWDVSYGAEGDPSWTEARPVDVTVNQPMNAWAGSGCNFNTTEDLTAVTITFVKSASASEPSQITVAGQSGVEAVEATVADAPAVYYNLQGMRVAAPEAGQLYIVNRAGKISKELAR